MMSYIVKVNKIYLSYKHKLRIHIEKRTFKEFFHYFIKSEDPFKNRKLGENDISKIVK